MAITTRDDLLQRLAKGQGWRYLEQLTDSVATTNAVVTAGGISLQGRYHTLGTTLPGTLVSIPVPTVAAGLFVVGCTFAQGNSNNFSAQWLGWLYRFGTVSFAATGDKLTADAGIAFPVKRTRLGAAAQPVPLIPVMIITTALGVTAPTFQLRTVAGVAGYVNQAGASIIGATTITPPVSAAVGTMFMLNLETNDSAVQNITAVQVTGAGSAVGAASLYGLEIMACATGSYWPGYHDALHGGFSMVNIQPAVLTTGTFATGNQVLAMIQGQNTVAVISQVEIVTVNNT